LLGDEPLDDVVHLAAHRADGSARALVVDALEVKGASSVDIDRARRVADEAAIAAHATFVEVPWDVDHVELAAAARAHGVALKLRTGGVTADAFPEADVVARFMSTCVAGGVPFKLTAGLHHPLRGEHPLTYEPGCARGTMHGFLNVLAAAALLAAGHHVDAMLPLLEERDAAELTFGDEGLAWRGHEARLTAAHTARRLLRSFGSCSFDEPVEQLRALGWLPTTQQPSHAP
jgi:hypothetical protein